MPLIAVMNESTAISDADVQAIMTACHIQWNRDLSFVWVVRPSIFTFIPKGQTPPTGAWWMVFLDNSDQAGALAYHDLTSEGLPIAKVFVKTILDDKGSVSVAASHEVLEMAVDPWLNGAFQDPRGRFWASEIADPVEGDQFGYKIGEVLVSDFIFPTWFAHQSSVGPIDHTGHATKAFEVLSEGYAQYFDPHQGWVQITGAAVTSFRAIAAPVGSRRERRLRQWRGPSLIRSAPR